MSRDLNILLQNTGKAAAHRSHFKKLKSWPAKAWGNQNRHTMPKVRTQASQFTRQPEFLKGTSVKMPPPKRAASPRETGKSVQRITQVQLRHPSH